MKKRSRNNTHKLEERGRAANRGHLLEAHEKVHIAIRRTSTRTIGPKKRRRMDENAFLGPTQGFRRIAVDYEPFDRSFAIRQG